MGNKSSLMLQDDEIKQISEQTGFSSRQIEKLYSRFAHLDRSSCGTLSRDDLMSIPELAINPLCERLLQMFFPMGHSDHDSEDERINFKRFMEVLAAFRSSSSSSSSSSNKNGIENQSDLNNDSNNNNSNNNNTINMIIPRKIKAHQNHTKNDCLTRKLLFIFRIYDADNDGRISFGDLRSILKLMVGNYIEDVRLDKIATRAFVEVDQDNDGFIEFREFCRVFANKDLDDKLRIKFFN